MKIDLNSNFVVFNVCIPVKGYTRSLICDVQNNDYFYIPNELFTILTEYSKKTIDEIISIYGQENKEIIYEYFEFLIEKRVIALVNNKNIELFNKISNEWHNPKNISNAIIEWSTVIEAEFYQVLIDLISAGCESLELRFYDVINPQHLKEILNIIEKTSLKSIYLLIRHSIIVEDDEYKRILNGYSKIIQILIHGYDKPKKKISGNDRFSNIIFQKQIVKDCNSCGIVNQNFFRVNIELFNESLKYNTCLNRKISINKEGYIKNCPSLSENYGNIKFHKLSEVLKDDNIKELWTINKDQIEVCKDCEHRYICTDCRAYLNKNELYSKPVKCNYNPYKAVWETY